jgi:hypothetical protein
VSAFADSRRIARHTVTPSSPGSIKSRMNQIELTRPGERESGVAIDGLGWREPFELQVKRERARGYAPRPRRPARWDVRAGRWSSAGPRERPHVCQVYSGYVDREP